MKIAVIGAGIMGSGIAQVFAQSDISETVYLTDVNGDIAVAGKNRIIKSLEKLVQKERITKEELDNVISKIVTGEKNRVSDADLVIEAALENIELKKIAFKELDSIVKADAIFASNTSSLSITEIGAGLRHHLIGMHFFNPAPVMKLVEVIAGINTPENVVKAVCDIAFKIGKTPVRVQEAPGFVVNRILIPMINEAIMIYSEGVASVEDIDNAMKLGANHPMGPLALGDLVGLDVVLAIMEVLQRETGESKYRAAPLLRKMVRGGKLGRKTGEGFYKY